MSRRTNKLGDSWVVEGEEPETSSDESGFEDKGHPDVIPTRGQPRRGNRQARAGSNGPQLVMPSMDVDVMAASSTSASRGSRPASRSQGLRRDIDDDGPRRRTSRSTPVKGSVRQPTAQQAGSRRRVGAVEEAGRPPSFISSTADLVGSTIGYVGGLFGESLWILRTVLAYVLAGLILIGLLWLIKGLAMQAFYNAISPVCVLPGASMILPFCSRGTSPYIPGPSPPVEFDQLMNVQSKFEEVLEESAGGVSLPLDMKRGESSIRDLKQLVRYSSLHSKSELILEFDGFIETSRMASYDLQLFNSHVGRGVDTVLATTRWTTRVLDGIVQDESSKGAVQSFFSNNVFSLFLPRKFDEQLVLDQYIKHTRVVEEEIHKLIAEAQALLLVLNNLEDRLDVIHGIVTRDDVHAKKTKEEILSQLWTMVGGNRGKLNKMDRQLNLLGQVGVYRKSAYAHVSGTILRLQEMGVGLEDLRERVAAPELLRDRADIPLSVHIENIQRGVERLEVGRQNARELESGRLKQTLERNRAEERYIDG